MLAQPLSNLVKSFFTAFGVDTLLMSKSLQENGFSQKQSEVISEIVKESNYSTKGQETRIKEEIKEEVIASENRVEAKIDSLRVGMDQKIDVLEKRIDQNIDALEKKIDLKIDNLEHKIDTKVNQYKVDVVKMVINAAFAQFGIMLTATGFIYYSLTANMQEMKKEIKGEMQEMRQEIREMKKEISEDIKQIKRDIYVVPSEKLVKNLLPNK